jgi:hypothetical protein
MATKRAIVKVSPATLKSVKEIKKTSGVAIAVLADRGLEFFCAAVQNGDVVIQNGQIIQVPAEARS